MSDLLEVDSVIKSFGERQVLTDIYLSCKTGEALGILGRNGTGKSTLLKIIFGSEFTEMKFIRLNGVVYDKLYKAENAICYLPQDNFLPGNLRLEKIVELFLSKKAVDAFLEDPILQSLSKSKVSELSGGELRYLEVKLLLNSKAKFVLLDEPFNGVSPLVVELIKAMIKECSGSKGIILTDHDYRNVLDVADRYCLIFDGGMKNIENKDDLIKWGYISK